jgi:hypothetical protein
MNSRALGILVTSIVFAMLSAGVLLPLPWLARESIFEFTARMENSKDFGEPDTGSPLFQAV